MSKKKTKKYFWQFVLLALPVLVWFAFCNNASAWYSDTNLNKRIKITIDDAKVNGTVSNFPVYVNLADLPASFFDDISANGGELRVTKTNGSTEVAREVVWIDRTANAGELHFVANGNLTNSGNSDFYLYYGNPVLTSYSATDTYGTNRVWTASSYTGVWHLHQDPSLSLTSANIVNSVSTNYYGIVNGTLSSSSLVAGQMGKSIYFKYSASNYDGINLGTSMSLSNSTITVTGWVKRKFATSTTYLYGQSGYTYAISQSTFMNWYGGGGSGMGGVANDANWHYAAFVIDTTNVGMPPRAKISVDGSTLANTASGVGTLGSATGPMFIGRGASATSNGYVDEFRIANNVTRSGSWVRTEFYNQNSTSTFYRVTAETGTDVDLPLASSLSPNDNGSVDVNGNFIITFNEYIDIQTGNIYIKKVSDNSTVETISVTSGLVSGNGTNIITINPNTTLDENTSYYILVDATAFDDRSGNSYAGIASTTAWNFTTTTWYNSSWTKRVGIVIDDAKVNGTVANFSVYVDLKHLPASFFTDVATNGTDLRVAKADGSEVAAEVVYLNKTTRNGELHFVANGNLTNSGNSDYYLYYKNPGAPTLAGTDTYGKYNLWSQAGYAAVWHLNESPTGTVYNSATSVTCTSYGSMLSTNRVAGQLSGNGTYFNSSNQYLNCGDLDALDAATKFTFSGWLKRANSTNSVNVAKGNSSSNRVSFGTYSTDFRNEIGSNSNQSYISSFDTSWHHLMVIFNGTPIGNSNRLVQYKDGSINSLSYSGSIPSATNEMASNGVLIGYDYSNYTYGTWDEVRIASRPRNGSWYKTEYNNQSSPSTFYRVKTSADSTSDISAPLLYSLSPSDNATNIDPGTNLIITFNEYVDLQTGNIYIKKSSDNSTLATISVASGLVTGNGTNSITINPSSNLPEANGIYLQIDSGAIKDLFGNSYTGIANTTTWNFTTNAWFNSNWAKRIKFTIDDAKVNGSVTNFPVYLNLKHLPASFFTDVAANGTDLRITRIDGRTQLPVDIVYLKKATRNGELHFAVNGALTNVSNSDFYLYYKNPGASLPSASSTYGKYNVWSPSGYIGVWHLNESPASAATLYNSASSSYNCVSNGMAATNRITGNLSGNGTSFDSSNDYLSCGDINELDSASKFSFSGWLKRASSAQPVGISKGNAAANKIELGAYSTTFRGYFDSNSNYSSSSSNDTNWHHLMVIFNGTLSGNSNRSVHYQDGILASTSFVNNIPSATANTGTNGLIIGYGPNFSYTYGSWDEVRISTVTRDGSWYKTEYNNQNSPSTFYRFDSSSIDTTPDTQNPSIYTLSPADGTYVVTTANLIVTFDENIDIQTGNIYLKKSSDNSTVETISVTGGLVTGNGTNTITINPNTTLSPGNGYYIQIDATAFDDMFGNSYAGINDTTTWNFTARPVGAWFNGDWHYRVKISINRNTINGSVSNFPVFVDLAGLNTTTFFDNVRTDGADIRVTQDDGFTEVAREIASISTTTNAGELHFLANGTLANTANGDYYIYYNNVVATEPTANGVLAKEGVWTNSFLGVWHLSTSPVNQLPDSTSNNYDCTPYAGTSINGRNLVAGKVGYGMFFNGALQQRIYCGTSSNILTNLQSKTYLSLSAWMKRKLTTSNMTMGTQYSTSTTGQLGITTLGSTTIYAPQNGTSNYGSYTNGSVSWRHVSWIYDGTQGTNATRLKLYHDGVVKTLSYSSALTSSTYNQFTTSGWPIGEMFWSNTAYYSYGTWDEVRLSSTTRSINWVKTEYNNLNSPSTFYSLASPQLGNDTKAPGIYSLSPADESLAIPIRNNLVITFNEYVDLQTGNIYIKKALDNSTLETISVAGARVTGNGTNIITIDPVNDLPVTNGVYIQIDATAIKDLYGNFFPGINNTTTWNFTTRPAGAWFNGDWHNRVKVTVNKTYVNGDLTNFPVYVNLTALNGTSFFTYVKSDGSDIRVTQDDGLNPVAREVAYINTSTKVGELYFLANGSGLSATYNGDYYIYYNNPTATEPTTNGAYAKESVWANSYIAVWHLNSDYEDSGPGGNGLGIINGINGNNLVSGKVNFATLFNGTQQQYLESYIPNSPYFAGGGKTYLSLSAWLKRRANGANISLGAANSAAYAFGVLSAATTSIQSNVSNSASAYGSFTSNDTNWHQIHWLFDGTQGGNSTRLKVYYDGLVQAGLSFPAGSIPSATFSVFQFFDIGSISAGTRYYTNGYWDEIRISNTTRTPNWVKTEYNNLNSPSTFYTLTLQQSTDTKAPTIYSISPADNATGARYNTNLVLTFVEAVDTQAGNIVIKKSSDNSTVQTIAANSGSVTGNGTNIITVNINDLASNNGYYVQIANTAITDLSGNAYAGINDTTSWNFTVENWSGAWYNGDWHSRIKVDTNHNYINGDLSNFPVYVNLSLLNGTSFFTYVKSDGSDIRVTKIDGITEVAREVAYINTTAKTGELYFVANGTLSGLYNGSYYVYYNNPLASETTGAYIKENVWTNSYIGVWHLVYNALGEYLDSTSNNYDCSASGGVNGNNLVTSTSSKTPHSLLFNGTQQQYIDCALNTPLHVKTKLSLSGWAKRRSSTSNISMGGGEAHNQGWPYVGFYSTATKLAATAIPGASTGSNGDGQWSSSDTNWHHLNMLYNGTASLTTRLKVYYDGIDTPLLFPGLIGSATGTPSINGPFRIGYNYTNNATTYYTNGYWDEVRLSSVVRSADWAKTEYNNLNSPQTFSNLSIEQGIDTKAPTVISFTPADNATNVNYKTDLTIVFSEYIDTQTGNIVIKKSSNNSTVETIAINSGSVTGNGTTTLVIDINDLPSNNGYYVQIDNTAITDLAGNAYAGINNTTSWNFTVQNWSGSWYNGDWHFRVKVSVDPVKVNGDLSNFPIYVNLNGMPAEFFTYLNANGSDIRVTKIDGSTLLAREVADVNTSARTGELYFVANGTLSGIYPEHFYIYYGNPLVTEPTANGTYSKEKVWVNNYIGVWHFNSNNVGDVTYESTSNNYDLTRTGNNVDDITAGKINYSLDLNGSLSEALYTSTAINSSLANKTNLSLSAWVKRRYTNSIVSLGAWNGTAQYSQQRLGILVNGTTMSSTIAGTVNFNGTSNGAYFTSNDTNWHQVHWAYDGTASGNANRFKNYFDGAYQPSTYTTSVIPSSTNSLAALNSGFYIGRMSYTIQWTQLRYLYTQGYIDEVRLSSATRSSQWAITEYNNLNSPTTFYTLASQEFGVDTKPPAVVSFTPADNATGVRYNNNLTIQFNDYIDTQTGNIYVKKSSDNSTVQTISISSGAVTGNGTTSLNIDINDLDANNGYYIQIDNTAIKDIGGNNYAGINNSTTWNFTTHNIGVWYNGDWHFRVKVSTNTAQVNGDLTNYPMYINLNGLSATVFFDYLNANGSDIRVTKIDGTTLVAREVAFLNRTSNAGELYFSANGTLSKTYGDSFYIYFGNPMATEPTANGTYAKERVWNGNYLGVWHFVPLAFTADSTTNNNDCSTVSGLNGSNLVTGKVNYAMTFNGTQQQYLSCGTISSLASKANVSLSAWMKRSAASKAMNLGSSTGNYLGIQALTSSTFAAYPGYSSQSATFTGSNDTSWHHLAWMYDGSKPSPTTKFRVYSDGVAPSLTNSVTATATDSSYSNPFSIGVRVSATYSTGAWDEVRLSLATRSINWTKTEYNNLNSPSTFYNFSAVETYSPDVKPPVLLNTTTPADNSTGQRLDVSLVMNFSDYIDTQTGNIYVKKTSDNSTVQTISILSAAVTGNGTSSLTVDINDLMSNNGYYIQIDSTAVKDLAGNSFAGIIDTTTWNFATRREGEWFNGSWAYRTKITVNNAYVNGASLSNFPVYVNLAHLSFLNFFNRTKSDGSDIRVTKVDGTTQVAREIAYFNATSNGGEMYFVANGTLSGTVDEDFFVYYGNAGASEPTANGTYAKESVWIPGYLGVWHMNTDPSTKTNDSTSNNYDCTQSGSMNSADLVSGKVNYALDFDGSNDYVNCPVAAASVQSKAKLSLSGWFQRRAAAANISMGSTYTGSWGSFGFNTPSGSTTVYSTIAGYATASGSISSNDTSWHYINILYNGSAVAATNPTRLTTYYDGVAYNTGYSGTIPATTVASFNYPFRIGYIYEISGSNTYTNGYWDEVRLSNVTRSLDWAKTEYNNLNSPSTFYTVGRINKKGNPGVESYSPADDSTYVSVSTNLVITFDEYVMVQTGNIVIKKSSDDSIVETMSVNGSRVTLTSNGRILTIDPVNNLEYSNGYYIQIDANAVKDPTLNGYPGIANTTTWNFTTIQRLPLDWFQDGGLWQKRIKLEVNKSQVNGSVSNFPVFVNLNGMPASFTDDILANGADLRITKSDGLTQVAREIVFLNRTANAGEMHFIANGTLTNASNGVFYLYYKNSSVTEPSASATYGKYNTWTQASYSAVWHLNESPAGTQYNSASSSYNCTSSGSMTSANRVLGILSGNGTSFASPQYLDCGDVNELDSASKFTVSGWAKKNSGTGNAIIFNKYVDGNNYNELDLYSSSLYTGPSIGSGGSYASVGTLANDTNWHHLVQIFNGTASGNSNRLNIYNNGSLQTLSFSGSSIGGTTAASSTNIIIARSNSPSMLGTQYTVGRLDEIRVASRARNGSWVKTEYNNQITPRNFYSLSSAYSYNVVSVSSLSPADDSTGVGASNNLVITFDRKIDLQSGNIYIKRSSNGSTLQTISVASGEVTGNGTSIITINPNSDLPEGIGVYVQIDNTAIQDTGGNSYAGIGDTTTWNFTTSAWYNKNWTKRIKVTVNAAYVNGSVTNFPVYIRMSDLPAAFYDDVANNGADMRVTKGDGSTLVAREVVFVNKTQNAGELHFVANGTLTNAANTDFFIYYKQPAQTEPSASSTYGKYSVWTPSSYAVVWHLHENPSGTIYNSVSTSYTCASSGSMGSSNRIAGQLAGNGTNFSGSSQYLDCGDITQLNSAAKFTLSGWGRRTSGGNTVTLLRKYNSATILIMFEYYSGNLYSFITGNTSWTNGTSAPTNDTNWHHLVTIFDGTQGSNATKLINYADGTAQSLTFTNNVASSTGALSGYNAIVGYDSSYSGQYTSGRMDEIRISSLARNGSWIKTEYNNQNSPTTFYSVSAIETTADTQVPTVISFSPSDDSLAVAINTNLVITFDEYMDIRTGNLYIKLAADDSTVQTIAINSGAVSGNGTTTITINPPSDLDNAVTYYIQIDSGALTDLAGNSYAIADTTTWNFTTANTTGWYSSSWLKRNKFRVNKSTVNGTVYDFPVYLDLANFSSTNMFNHMRTDGGDIRITQGDGITALPIELVYINTTTNLGELHFKAPHLSSVANADFYLYYKNANGRPLNAQDQIGANAVWSNGFAAVYHLQQDPNADVANAVVNSKRSRYMGSPSGSMTTSDLVSCQVGQCYDFDGSNDVINTADINEMDNATALTTSAWMKRRSNGNNVFINKGTSTTARFEIEFLNDGNVYFMNGNSGNTYGYIGNNNTNWHHAVQVFDGSLSGNNRLAGYIDGVAQGLSYSGTQPSTVASLAGNFTIGKLSTSASYTNGFIDEVRVANKARNRNWILTEYNNQYSPSTFYTINGTAAAPTDDAKPKIVDIYPKNRSSQFPLRANLIMNFNEPVVTGVGNITIYTSAGAVFETISINSGNVTGSGTSTITIDPTGVLAANTTYYVIIDGFSLQDGSSNYFAGIGSPSAWRFTTQGSSSDTNMFPQNF